jgi:CRISPR-associated protein Cas2
MFDLPTTEAAEAAEYRRFREFLIKRGFIMVQQSVYGKLVLNASISESVKTVIRKNLPKKGNVQLLEITEKQFSSIEYLVGKGQTKIIDSDKRLIEL